MPAYTSTELSSIQMLDPKRHQLALEVEAFLSSGGVIQELIPFQYVPMPLRNDPPPSKKAAKPKPKKVAPMWLDKLAQRDIEREERAKERVKERNELIERVRVLAETMTYAKAILHLGMPRRTLQKLADEGGFKFQPAVGVSRVSPNRDPADEAKQAKDAERIKAFMEIGLSRNQAMQQAGLTFKTFAKLLTKFNIDYPKRKAGPKPAFYPKTLEMDI